jgi:hypothetical protein
MSLIDILIIVACLGTGYWIVNSVLGGEKKTSKPESGAAPGWRPNARPLPKLPAPPASSKPATGPVPAPASIRPQGAASVNDWHIVLDVPRDASPRDIQAAVKRRLSQAEADGDAAAAERIRRAGEHALQRGKTP